MRAVVVGFGRMGGFHAKVLRELGHHVTTVDPDPCRMADYATITELPLSATGGSRFDIAAVAVPADYLLDTAYQLAGIPMLVEKPFALNVRDADLLAVYLAEKGSPVCVGFVERFNPQVRALRELLHDGTLGHVKHVKFTRWNDRPSFDVDLDLRLHDADLVSFLGVGAETVEFDTRAGCDRKVRTIEVTHASGVYTTDLMAHDLSPLHGLWHAFITGREHPTPADAIRALQFLTVSQTTPALAVAA